MMKSTVTQRWILMTILFAMIVFSVQPASAIEDPNLKAAVDSLLLDAARQPTNDANYIDRAHVLYDWAVDIEPRVWHLPHELMTASLYFGIRRHPSGTQYALLDRMIASLAFMEKQAGKNWGTFSVDSKEPVMVGTHATRRLTFKVGDVPIKEGGSIQIGIHTNSDMDILQSQDPVAPNYVSVESSSSAELAMENSTWWGIWGYVYFGEDRPCVRVKKGELKPGDKVTIVFGDTSKGSPGFLVQSFDIEFRLLAEVDFEGNGMCVPIGFASFPVVPDKAIRVEGVAPSLVKPDQPLVLKARARDRFGNVATSLSSQAKVFRKRTGWDSKQPVEVGALTFKDGLGVLENLALGETGCYRFFIETAEGLKGISNPVVVKQNASHSIYWGDLHGHSLLSDGIGDPEAYFDFAKDKAMLDFTSLSDHDFPMSSRRFEVLKNKTEEANYPKQFLTYFGYEWTEHTALGGHHNVYYRNYDGKEVTIREAVHPYELYKVLRERNNPKDVIVIPHCHTSGDWRCHDPEMTRQVEVFSKHGSFEYYANRFLERGARVGINAGTDDHTGHPGLVSAPARKATFGGLSAVYASTLDRNEIFDAMRNRHNYATSGPRIYLNYQANKKVPIGSEVAKNAGITLDIEAAGTRPIETIDVIKNGEVVHTMHTQKPKSTAAYVRIAMTSRSDPLVKDRVKNPMKALSFDGVIHVEGSKILESEIVHEGKLRESVQKENNGFGFYVETRGDTEAVLLKLENPEKAIIKMTIRAQTIVAKIRSEFGSRYHYDFDKERPILMKEGKKIEVKVSDLKAEGIKHTLNEKYEGVISIQPLAMQETGLVKVQWQDPSPKPGDYYYVRLTQVDKEQAWGSPIWIGE